MRGSGILSPVLLTVTSTAPSASDLGYLLHKHPARIQDFEVSVGRAHVFYPRRHRLGARSPCCSRLTRSRSCAGKGSSRPDGFSLAQYVNDRPYAASSMLAVALGRVFRSAVAGRCDARPDLPEQRLPLDIHIPALPCRGGPEIATRLFSPLGWTVRVAPIPLDTTPCRAGVIPATLICGCPGNCDSPTR